MRQECFQQVHKYSTTANDDEVWSASEGDTQNMSLEFSWKDVDH